MVTKRRSSAAYLMCAAICVCLSACSSPPLLDHAFLSTYPGFTEVSPHLQSAADDPDFAFVPGSVIVAWNEPSESGYSRIWNANTDLRCQSGKRLQDLASWKRAAYSVGSQRRATKSINSERLVKAFSLEDVAGFAIERLEVQITRVRSYQPAQKPLLKLAETARRGCQPLPGMHIVKAVIIGDIKIAAVFKSGIDLTLQAEIMNRIKLKLGVKYEIQNETEIQGQQIAFGVKMIEAP